MYYLIIISEGGIILRIWINKFLSSSGFQTPSPEQGGGVSEACGWTTPRRVAQSRSWSEEGAHVSLDMVGNVSRPCEPGRHPKWKGGQTENLLVYPRGGENGEMICNERRYEVREASIIYSPSILHDRLGWGWGWGWMWMWMWRDVGVSVTRPADSF